MDTLFPIESDRDRAFREFHEANPQVFDRFCELAERSLAAGQRVSARCIGENIRWHYTVEVHGDQTPKFNDLIWPRYARLLAKPDPQFVDFFEFRRSA